MNRRSFTQRLALFVLGCQLPFVPLRKADEFVPQPDPMSAAEAKRQFRELVMWMKAEMAPVQRWVLVNTAEK